MSSNLIEKVYSFVWKKDSGRYALITFMASGPDKWIFSECKYVGVGKIYNIDDWDFIGDVAEEVKALCKKEGII